MFGLGTRAQSLPFQCSISGWVAAPEPVEPTAQALAAEVAATDVNWLPAGSGATFCMLQRLPFQCSTSGAFDVPIPGPGPTTPTAQALAGEVAVTALK